MKQYKYLREEFHRGKWQPLIVEKKGKEIQAYAKITEEEAEIMNRNSDAYGVRYVLDSDPNIIDVDYEEVKKEYESLAEKKAYHGWDIDQLKEKIIELKK